MSHSISPMNYGTFTCNQTYMLTNYANRGLFFYFPFTIWFSPSLPL